MTDHHTSTTHDPAHSASASLEVTVSLEEFSQLQSNLITVREECYNWKHKAERAEKDLIVAKHRIEELETENSRLKNPVGESPSSQDVNRLMASHAQELEERDLHAKTMRDSMLTAYSKNQELEELNEGLAKQVKSLMNELELLKQSTSSTSSVVQSSIISSEDPSLISTQSPCQNCHLLNEKLTETQNQLSAEQNKQTSGNNKENSGDSCVGNNELLQKISKFELEISKLMSQLNEKSKEDQIKDKHIHDLQNQLSDVNHRLRTLPSSIPAPAPTPSTGIVTVSTTPPSSPRQASVSAAVDVERQLGQQRLQKLQVEFAARWEMESKRWREDKQREIERLRLEHNKAIEDLKSNFGSNNNNSSTSVTALNTEITLLKSQLEQAKQDAEVQRRTARECQATLSRAVDAERSLAKVATTQAVAKEKEVLTKQLQHYKDQYESVKVGRDQFESQVKLLTSELLQMEGIVDLKTSESKKMQSSLTEAITKVTDLQRQLEESKSETNAAKAASEAAKQREKDADCRALAIDEKNEKLTMRITNFELDLNEGKEMFHKLQQEKQNVLKLLEDEKNDRTRDVKVIAELKEQELAAQATISDLRQQHGTTLSAVQQLTSEIQALQVAAKKHNDEINSVELKCEELKTEYKIKEKKNLQLIKELRSQLSKMETQSSNSQQHGGHHGGLTPLPTMKASPMGSALGSGVGSSVKGFFSALPSPRSNNPSISPRGISSSAPSHTPPTTPGNRGSTTDTPTFHTLTDVLSGIPLDQKVEMLEGKNQALTSELLKAQEELEKKDAVIRHYTSKAKVSGALSTAEIDQEKHMRAKRGGLMGTLFGGKDLSSGNSDKLSSEEKVGAEAFRKMESILQETVLHNINLQTDVSTLGTEVGRLMNENQQLLSMLSEEERKIFEKGPTSGHGHPDGYQRY